MASDEWVLYVDESGDFGEDPYSCVVGLTMREQECGKLERDLRAAVEGCFPLVPWPPHATALNIPVSRAAACLLSEAGHDQVRSACSRAVEALRAAKEEPALRDFWRCVEAGRMPAYSQLRAADAWLKAKDGGAHERLRQLVRVQDRRMRRLLRGLALSGGEDDVFVVGAVQARQGGAPEDDGYLRCLEALFERLIALVDAEGVRQAVRFRVATRHVDEPSLGVRIPLNAKHVVDLVQDAKALAAKLIEAEPGVRCVPLEHQTKYDERVHAGVVLADFLANRVRRVLRSSKLSWSEVGKGVRGRTGIAPEARARRFDAVLPALTFEGPLRSWLLTSRGVEELQSMRAPRWAVEQARRWAEAVRQL